MKIKPRKLGLIHISVFIGQDFKGDDALEDLKQTIHDQLKKEFHEIKSTLPKKPVIIKNDELKYLDKKEIRKLKFAVVADKEIAIQRNTKVSIKDWFFAEVGLNTGLRVKEISELCCGDYCYKENSFVLKVRKGKGNKPGIVVCPKKFKESFFWFINWKKQVGEPVESDSPIFYSSATNRHITTRALQNTFKRILRKAGLDTGYGTHALRRTYGTFLNHIAKDIRVTQEQLRHSNIRTTQSYTFVIQQDTKRAVEKLRKLIDG